jgi:hypothetical protein
MVEWIIAVLMGIILGVITGVVFFFRGLLAVGDLVRYLRIRRM